MADRKSEAETPVLVSDPIELAKREASNALDQFDWGMDEVDRWLSSGRPNLKVSMLLELHRRALDGIDQYAGNFRPAGVAIKGSKHAPVASNDVARYVEEMLDYLQDNWADKTGIHLSAYAMWRLNWIHPFADGNGRTSRIFSYMVLCGCLGQRLPGKLSIPEQIAEDKTPYYHALEQADAAYRKGSIDVSEMEKLLEGYLANQLLDVHGEATGKNSTIHENAAPSEQDDTRWRIVRSIESHPVIAGGIFLLIATAIGIFFA